MKFTLAIACLLPGASAHQSFKDWSQSKTYESNEASLSAERIYNNNLIVIDEMNAVTTDNAIYAPNKFADMTPEEFKLKLLLPSCKYGFIGA